MNWDYNDDYEKKSIRLHSICIAKCMCVCIVSHSICSIKSIFNNKLAHSLCLSKRFITHSFRVFYSFTMHKWVHLRTCYNFIQFNLIGIWNYLLKINPLKFRLIYNFWSWSITIPMHRTFKSYLFLCHFCNVLPMVQNFIFNFNSIFWIENLLGRHSLFNLVNI